MTLSFLLNMPAVLALVISGCSGQSKNDSLPGKFSSDSTSTARPSDNMNQAAKSNANLTAIYSQVIGDYIKLVKKEKKLAFDTLFFGKHVFGQPDDFPDIELPAIIEKTNIQLISPEQGSKSKRTTRHRLILI